MNNKKLFIKIKNVSSKVGDYLDKKGFYIVILLCIVVIGATITIVSIRDYKKLGSDLSMDDVLIEKEPRIQGVEKPVVVEPSENKTKPITGLVTERHQTASAQIQENKPINAENRNKTKNKVNTIVGKEMNHKDKTSQSNKTKAKTIIKADVAVQETSNMRYPVYGKIINEFAQGKLIFSKTLQQWTTHAGIDISSDKGTPVKASLSGVVRSIKNDPRYGITITIEHKGGLKTIYANLSSASMVKTGQEVRGGTVISGVGSTANFESEDTPHLHFEVLKDDKNVNPVEYLSAIK